MGRHASFGLPDVNVRLRIDGPCIAVLLAVAAALRLPYNADAPRLTEETGEILLGLGLYRGEEFPLVNVASYTGALYAYVIAGVFWLVGPGPFVPRLFMVAVGAATAGMVYLWAKESQGRLAGFLAGGVLAFSVPHIWLDGHDAVSQSLTPALATAGLWLLERAVEQRGKFSILASGLILGLALQSHPAVSTLLPGAAVYLLVKGRNWLRSRWLYGAGILFLLAYSNVLLYNLQTGGDSFRRGLAQRAFYHELLGPEKGPNASHYVAWLWDGLITLGSLPALEAANPQHILYVPSLFTPWSRFYAALGLAGLVYLTWRGRPLPLLACLSVVLSLPAMVEVNITWERYWILLVPAFCVAMGALLALGISFVQAGGGLVLSGGVFILALLFFSYPLPGLMHNLERRSKIEPTNRQLEEAAGIAAGMRREGESLQIDHQIFRPRVEDETEESRSLSYFLSLQGIPHEWWNPLTRSYLLSRLKEEPSVIVIVDSPKYRALRRSFDFDVLGRVGEAVSQDERMPVVVGRVSRRFQEPEVFYRVGAVLEEAIKLVGYEVNATKLSPGDSFTLTLYWQALGKTKRDYTVFTQLLDDRDRIIGQQDNQPVKGVHPTSQWLPGEYIRDEYELTVRPDAKPGPARVIIGMYLWPSMERQPVTQAIGNPGQDFLELPSLVTVTP